MENNQGVGTDDAKRALDDIGVARKATSRRVLSHWSWDAGVALSIGIYLALAAYLEPKWLALYVPAWVIAYIGFFTWRRNYYGVDIFRTPRGRRDRVLVLMWSIVLLVYVSSIVLEGLWKYSPVVGSAVAAANSREPISASIEHSCSRVVA